MGIRVMGIAGSPRRYYNSEFLLELALGAAKSVPSDWIETELHSIAGTEFRGCVSCFGCVRTKGSCVIRDDFEDLKTKWEAVNVVLHSVPVYHMGLPGQMKGILDRLGNTTACRYMPDVPKQLKVIGGTGQGAYWFSGQDIAIMQIVSHALMMDCIPVCGDMPECCMGTVATSANGLGKDAV